MHEEEDRKRAHRGWLSNFSTVLTAEDPCSATEMGCNVSLDWRLIWSESARQQTHSNCICDHSSHCPEMRSGGRKQRQYPQKAGEDSKATSEERGGGRGRNQSLLWKLERAWLQAESAVSTASAGHRSSSPNIGLRKWASEILTTAACLFCKQKHRLSQLLKEHLVFLNHF